MTSAAAALRGYFARSADRRARVPSTLAYGLDARPPALTTLFLALQHVAIQSVYFVLPVAIAGAITNDPAEITHFLSLSILSVVIWQVIQLLTRGPLGAGYPIPATHTAALLSAYLLTAQSGGGFGRVGALVFLTGIGLGVLTFVMHRLRALLPNEVAGVVVMLIGIALIGVGTQQFGMQPGHAPPTLDSTLVLFASLVAMAGASLSRTRAAPFAVLIGALVGVALAMALHQGLPDAAAVLAARPWFWLPRPVPPDFAGISPSLVLAYVLPLIALQATAAGSLVMAQRAVDADWTRPDAPPIRRGLLGNAVAVALAGLFGAGATGPAMAAVGLSVATGTMARRIVWVGAALLVLIAFCPKFVALFVLTPAPVKAAMLFYVSGFIMAQGANLATVRLLDTRRTLIIASGLTAGVAVAIAPQILLQNLPAFASPLSLGAVVAFLVNLVTLPLVGQRAVLTLPLDRDAGRAAGKWFDRTAAAWGLKPQTAQSVGNALGELAHLLTERGTPSVTLTARSSEDRVEVALAWQGAPLPERTGAVSHEALLGTAEDMEKFILWMATREAYDFTQRATAEGCEARLVFED
ncbi:MAG: hypothetical protein JSR21_11630 [Proteobacteria bacterium]|nr:hypothetical protein [Pseudomonadota bacterium]